MRRDLAVCLFLVMATLAAYGQVARHDFVNFDDDHYVYENPHVRRGLTWENVGWAFTTMRSSNWHPLTWLSHMLDCELFGQNAGAHHLVNLFLHLLNSLLLYLVLKAMTGAAWRSAMVATLFALHPLHVESVAWVAERKDVLSTLFFMLTLWAYGRYVARPCLNRYGPVFAFLALGLMAKPMLVTLPFVLLLLDYWPLGRLGSARLLVEKIPLFALVAVSSVVTFVAQQRGGATSLTQVVPFGNRLANALISYTAYLGKTVWPSRLAVFYPYRELLPAACWVGALAALAAMSVLTVWAGRRWGYLAVGWFWYLGTLVPVIGLVQVGRQSMADRYTYIPLIGVFVIVVWGSADLMGGWRRGRVLLAGCALLVTVGCGVMTWLQVGHWRNSITLFSHTLKSTEDNVLAHTNLGAALTDRGQIEVALTHYHEALRINPNYADTHNNLGVALARQGKQEEAIAHYRMAIRLDPAFANAHNNLGASLVRQGKQDEAIAHYREALRIDPSYANAHNNLGVVLMEQGKLNEAISHYDASIRIDPEHAPTHTNLGMALMGVGRFDEAIMHYQKAVRIDPDDPRPLNNLAWARATHPDRRLRNGSEAVALAERACELTKHKDYNSLDTLAAAYAEAGRYPEAIATLEEAISLARSAGQEELMSELAARLQGYREGRPYREKRILRRKGEE